MKNIRESENGLEKRKSEVDAKYGARVKNITHPGDARRANKDDEIKYGSREQDHREDERLKLVERWHAVGSSVVALFVDKATRIFSINEYQEAWNCERMGSNELKTWLVQILLTHSIRFGRLQIRGGDRVDRVGVWEHFVFFWCWSFAQLTVRTMNMEII